MTEPVTLTFWAGEDIESAARRLVNAAYEHGFAVGTFNGVELKACQETAAHDVVMHYTRDTARRQEEWDASPEGKAQLSAWADERQRLQSLHDELVAQLDTLDFSKDCDVIDWLSQMADPSDRIGVTIDRRRILSAFKAHGLVPGMDVGVRFKSDDKHSFYRWLVGQALDGVQKSSIHGIFHKFAREWREKFEVAQ